jgi:hypothetical protein
MESSEGEWSDEDSGSDGERQAADDDDGNYTNRYGGQSSSLGVAKGWKCCGNHESADDRGQRCLCRSR